MDKQTIARIVLDAITEVSPFASELLQQKKQRYQDLMLVDLGINSIDYAEIAIIVMNRLGIDQSLEIFTCKNRISEVVDIFYDLIAVGETV